MFDEDEVQPKSERLQAEIRRVEQERNRKRGDRSAAESLFKA